MNKIDVVVVCLINITVQTNRKGKLRQRFKVIGHLDLSKYCFRVVYYSHQETPFQPAIPNHLKDQGCQLSPHETQAFVGHLMKKVGALDSQKQFAFSTELQKFRQNKFGNQQRTGIYIPLLTFQKMEACSSLVNLRERNEELQ